MVKQEADQQMFIITLSQFIWSCSQLSSLIKHSSHVLVGCCFYFVLFFVYFGLELNLSSPLFSPSVSFPFLPISSLPIPLLHFSSHLFPPHPSPSLFLPPFSPNPSPSLFFPPHPSLMKLFSFLSNIGSFTGPIYCPRYGHLCIFAVTVWMQWQWQAGEVCAKWIVAFHVNWNL